VKTIFADTLYWIALINPKDQWSQRTLEVEDTLQAVRLITTEIVLIEFLNYFCNSGSVMRQAVGDAAQRILQNPMVEVLPLTHGLFVAGLQLYGERLDKGYSLTDCISMIVMKEYGLMEILTHDRHLSQEGFQVLL
jgi:predicted nucleic acid-binding protein